MPSRASDWWRQAQHDLSHAEHSAAQDFHDWACFAAQQAAEKAVKGVIQSLGGEVRGHGIQVLLSALSQALFPEGERDGLLSAARELDRHYIPARYPNGVPQGAPFESYGAEESRRAIAAAHGILRFCERHLAGSPRSA